VDNKILFIPAAFKEEMMADMTDEEYDTLDELVSADRSGVPATMLLSEAALSRDWNTPDEDAAWADL
jgi:hypothetical protein